MLYVLRVGTKTEELFHAWAGDLQRVLDSLYLNTKQTRQSEQHYNNYNVSPTWPSWPATTAYWSTDQTIHVLLLWIKLIFAEIKEGWVFYLLTGPTLASIWIEHPLNKSLCPCQNGGLLQLPAANFTKNEILFELMLKIYIDTMNAEWCSSQFVIHEVACGT